LPAEPPAALSWSAKYGVWVTVGIATLAPATDYL
jgi:hypothetical protein